MEEQKTPPPKKTTHRWCAGCKAEVERTEFSKTQMKKKVAKCKTCCGGGGGGRGGNQVGNSINSQAHQQQLKPTEPTPISLTPRPQVAVPGFEGLTVCRDWPPTKNGRPPNSQSLVFIPLLACALCYPIDKDEEQQQKLEKEGPTATLEGYCTQEQLKLAFEWWALALPHWGKWVSALHQVLLNNTNLRRRLLETTKGRPCALIPKTKGRGTAPHFNGRVQEEVLEMAPTIAIEVYACVTCIYSAGTMMTDDQPQQQSSGKQ